MTDSPWRPALHARLRGQPLPLLVHADGLLTGASLWAGARLWVAWLRDVASLQAGDRIVCAVAPGPAFLQLLVASLWSGYTFVPVAATADPADALREADARLAVAGAAGPHTVAPTPTGAPPDRGVQARERRGAVTPEARFLLRTSGTAGAPRLVALSDANVRAVLDAHVPRLALDDACVLSVLPWHHAFGLVLDLLPALLAGAEIVRDPDGGRDPRALAALARAHPITHLNAVPRTVRALADTPGGTALLRGLRGGIVGGAPIDGALAAILARTRLRVGYGQTEASPGIALGEPGEASPGWLGRPLGCEVRADADGVLAFRGPNACLGHWADGALETLPAVRWVRTGDRVRLSDDGGLWFEGRAAHAFKLANGRFVCAESIERAVVAAFADVGEAVVSSPDGERLQVAVSLAGDVAAPGAVPRPDQLAPMLGLLAGRPVAVARVAPEAWVRTPKGEIDRRFPTGRPAAPRPPRAEAD